ncbi:MarR family transcriptional regulator [Sphingomonas sp. HF-S3]|uniref:MarR family transcriptional regulator n=1 Tax=Sphingomonas rustica TaxID=3103142 RepID=A0ABV0BEH5_9SPHN
MRATLRLARRLRQPACEGEATGSGLALLASLHRRGPMSAVALARSEGLQPQSLSRLLARLDQDALIERTVDPDDRRRHLIALTDTGRAALHRAFARRRQWLAAAIAGRLDDADRATLLAASDIMLRLAEDPQDDDHD